MVRRAQGDPLRVVVAMPLSVGTAAPTEWSISHGDGELRLTWLRRGAAVGARSNGKWRGLQRGKTGRRGGTRHQGSYMISLSAMDGSIDGQKFRSHSTVHRLGASTGVSSTPSSAIRSIHCLRRGSLRASSRQYSGYICLRCRLNMAWLPCICFTTAFVATGSCGSSYCVHGSSLDQTLDRRGIYRGPAHLRRPSRPAAAPPRRRTMRLCTNRSAK